jgi:hypothetical protein
VKVLSYKSGDFFGELALLRNVPRQASIQAVVSEKSRKIIKRREVYNYDLRKKRKKTSHDK